LTLFIDTRELSFIGSLFKEVEKDMGLKTHGLSELQIEEYDHITVCVICTM